MSNRLHLDFNLKTNTERSAFVNQYILRPEFQSVPLTEDELETLGNYVLWGVDPQTGLNGRQSGQYDLKTRYGTWDTQEAESLDALFESPTFNEAALQPLGYVAPAKKIREVFNREIELRRAGAMSSTLMALFKQIDALDYQLTYYEIMHGKRTKPARDELLDHLEEYGIAREPLEEATTHWGQYLYLKKKHELVELRREQYTLRDAYAPITETNVPQNAIVPTTASDWGAGIEVLPLGLNQADARRLMFRPLRELNPEGLSEKELRVISDIYWKHQALEEKKYKEENVMFFDFRNAYHVQKYVTLADEIDGFAREAEFDANIGALIETFRYYVEEAKLDQVEEDLLDLKIKGIRNQDIAQILNEKYGKSYTTNYISTIYCQRVIGKITEAANRQLVLVENLWYPEEWKKCTRCGRMLLRDNTNFTKKSRASDGLSSRCKECEKEVRLMSKMEENKHEKYE